MILEKLGKLGAIICGLLYAASLLLDHFNVYSLDQQYRGYLLSAAMICLGVYLLKKVQHFIFGVIAFAIAAVVLIYALNM
ncbi:MAG: hypothetical protein IK130_08900 [Oscillospiraceae bacterium]|nr:hypothetical protein [Oscillospiraceae bacterium]